MIADEHYCVAFRLQVAFVCPLIGSFLTDLSEICHFFGDFGLVYPTTHKI
jgi:hypothetical protein